MNMATVYSIGSMNSEGMLSDNPKAGIHETDVARIIDTNGSNPGGYQGGDIVVVCQAPDVGGVSQRSISPDFRIQEEDGGTGAKQRKR